NLIPAKIENGGQTISTSKFSFQVPQSLRAVTGKNDGKSIVIGLRPENIVDARIDHGGETARVSMDVEIAEPLGHEVVVYGRIGDALLVAKLEPHHIPKIGEKIDLIVEIERLHFFDAQTEKRLIA